jgi:hypothetical protein
VKGAQLNRQVLAYALSLQDPEGNGEEVSRLIKNLPQKLIPIRNTVRTFAFHNKLFLAQAGIPELISDDDQASYLWMLLFGYGSAGATPPASWQPYHNNYLQILTRNINYEDESS